MLKKIWDVVLGLCAALMIAWIAMATLGNYLQVQSLLTTRTINNMRIAKLQKERKQMQKVIQRLAKMRGF